MGSSKITRFPMGWQASLGGMVEFGTKVHRVCGGRECGRGENNIDLRPMLEKEGPQGTLWNRRPICPHCQEPGHYMASAGMVFTPLLSDDLARETKRQLFGSLGLSARDKTRIKIFAERVTTRRPDPKGLSDLDAEVFITGRRMSIDDIPPPYRLLGHWGSTDLLFRDFNEGERAVWERRPKGPRPL